MHLIIWILGIYLAIGVATAAFSAYVGCRVAEKNDQTLHSILSFGWVYWLLVFLWPIVWIRVLLGLTGVIRRYATKENSSKDDLTPKD